MEQKAYVFPGQGSQVVGMGAELFRDSIAAREVFKEADDALGFRLSRLIFEGSNEDLRDTVNSQPAIMTTSIACWKAYEESRGKAVAPPDVVAGHSLGEYTSLVVCGSLDFGDAVRLVRRRGELMREAKPGSMAVVFGLDAPGVEQLCLEVGVELANDNSDDQVVVSGDTEAIDRVVDLAPKLGARKVASLAVSGGFHSSLMLETAEGLREAVSKANVKKAKIPIVANSTALPVMDAQDIQEELISGLGKCVKWKESVRYMVGSGVSRFVELGPGRVLSGLIKRIDKNAQAISVFDPASIRKASETDE